MSLGRPHQLHLIPVLRTVPIDASDQPESDLFWIMSDLISHCVIELA